MKNLSLFAFTILFLYAFPGRTEAMKEVGGTVVLAKGLDKNLAPGGTLFIFAKKAGTKAGDGQPPIAVLRIQQPKFPLSFKLTAENTMIPGGAFEGPFSLYARYSQSGDAMDKSGPEGTDQKHPMVHVGEKNVSIELKAK